MSAINTSPQVLQQAYRAAEKIFLQDVEAENNDHSSHHNADFVGDFLEPGHDLPADDLAKILGGKTAVIKGGSFVGSMTDLTVRIDGGTDIEFKKYPGHFTGGHHQEATLEVSSQAWNQPMTIGID